MASFTTSARPVKTSPPAAPPHGTCRWVEKLHTVLCCPSRTGILEITSACKGGACTHAYEVHELLDDATRETVGWQLLSDDGKEYTIDTTFGPDAEHWSCDCADSYYRERVCKHILAVSAGLTRLNREEADRQAMGELEADRTAFEAENRWKIELFDACCAA